MQTQPLDQDATDLGGGDPGLTALLTLIDEALSAVAGHTIVSASDISDRLLDIRLAAEKQ